MPTFDITRPKDVLKLDAGGRGTALFTVTNVMSKTIRARLDVIPDNPADQAMFSVEGGPERTMRTNETQNIRLNVTAPSTATSGSHKFSLRAVDVDLPDEHYQESQSVEFVIPERQNPDAMKFPWWIIPLGAVLLLAVGVTAWYLHTYPKLGEYRRGSVEDARFDLRNKGMEVNVLTNNIVLDEKENAMVVDLQINGQPAPAGTRVKRGTVITIEASGAMPKLVHNTLEGALSALQTRGLPQPLPGNIHSQSSLDTSTWDIVQFQSPDPNPPPNQPKASGKGIELWVNVKPDTIPTPGEVNKPYCTAANDVAQHGLNPVQATVAAVAFVAQGIVMAQTPPVNSPILKGSPVTLTHFGPPLVCGSGIFIFSTVIDLHRKLDSMTVQKPAP